MFFNFMEKVQNYEKLCYNWFISSKYEENNENLDNSKNLLQNLTIR
jgi:hypothetical protein